MFPRLAGNAVVKQDDASSLVHIILTGARATGTEARPTAPAMPSLGYRLNDSQIAAVVTYIRNSWGNAAARVDTDMVKTLRGRLN
jgi:mono/diheme cytochrome c family protein